MKELLTSAAFIGFVASFINAMTKEFGPRARAEARLLRAKARSIELDNIKKEAQADQD